MEAPWSLPLCTLAISVFTYTPGAAAILGCASTSTMGTEGKRKSRREEPAVPPSHRLLTSDELGLLKVSEVPGEEKWEEAAARQRWGNMDKQHGITRMQLFCPDWSTGDCLIATARAGGRVVLQSPASGAELGAFRAAPPATTSGRTDTSQNEVVGLRFVQQQDHAGTVSLVTCTVAGHVAVHRCGLREALRSVAEPGQQQQQQGQGQGGGGESGGEGGAGVPGGSGGGAAHGVVQTWEAAHRMQTVGNVQAMDASTSGRLVGVGGDGHQLKVWDLAAAGGSGSAAEPLFAGKAGKPSRSGLQDLAHVTALSFIPGAGGGEQQVLVGTSKHKLWLYDMRAGRKPQAELVWSEGRITCLLPTQDGTRVWVGNGMGQIEALDLRAAPSKIAMGHALKGSAGSIRSLCLHPTDPLIASVSLDRHLRIHHTGKRSLLAKVYLKQVLTGVAWLPVAAPPAAEEPSGGDGGRAEAEEDEDEGEGHAAGSAGEPDTNNNERQRKAKKAGPSSHAKRQKRPKANGGR